MRGWILSWRATFLHLPELNKRLHKHFYILTPCQIASTAKLLCQLQVQKQLSSLWLQPKQLFSDEGVVDFVMLKSLSSQRDGNAPLVFQRPMSLSPIARSLKFICLEDRVVLVKESHLVMATPLHRPPFVAAYSVMMSRDDGERASS